MKIDIHKYSDPWDFLIKYNEDLFKVFLSPEFHYGGPTSGYDVLRGGSSPWFDPAQFREAALTTSYPETDPRTRDKERFPLFLYAPNYLPLFLINLLYEGKDNTSIEDLCGGAGRLVFYLAKLGFNNFYLAENFSQVSPHLLSAVMQEGDIDLKLNHSDVQPQVLILIGYPWIPKGFRESVELFCVYPCDNMFKTIIPEIKEMGYKRLCEDSDYMCLAYCREDKYDEFIEKIKHYEVEEEE